MTKQAAFSVVRYNCICFKFALLPTLLVMFWIISVRVDASAAENVMLKINTNNSVAVNLKKYGVNGALLGSRFGYASDELVEVYKQTGIVFSRFPGGTIGNYYDWENNSFSCYRSADEKSIKRINRMNKTLIRKNNPYNIDDFFGFLKKSDSDFTYVLNTLCGSPESNSKLLSHMKNNNVVLNYIEIANELYSPSYSWAYRDAISYLKSIEDSYSAIKKNYPSAKIGLIVSPVSFSGKRDPGKGGVPNKSWPERQRQFDLNSAASQYGDALVIHLYGHPYHHKWSLFDPETDQEHYLKVLEQFNGKFQVSMNYLKSLGKGKPVWITEWGVTAPQKKQQGTFREYKKSAYQSLFMASVLISISLEPEIEIANYHNITDFWYKTKTSLKVTPLVKVLNLFTDAARNTEYVNSIYFNSEDEGVLGPGSGLKGLVFTSDTNNYLLLVNEQDRSYAIDRLNVTFDQFKKYSIEEMSVVNNEFIYTNKEKTYFKDTNNVGLNIKPFSILKIKLEK